MKRLYIADPSGLNKRARMSELSGANTDMPIKLLTPQVLGRKTTDKADVITQGRDTIWPWNTSGTGAGETQMISTWRDTMCVTVSLCN